MNFEINPEMLDLNCAHYGKDIVETVTIEECSELIQCITKNKRGRTDILHTEEEVADVILSVANLIHACGLDQRRINEWVRRKQLRQHVRMQRDE